MRILTTLFLLVFTSIAFAGTSNQLPNDDRRGTWFDTIDEDARGYAYNIQQDIVRKGPNALRFELRDGDCYTANPDNPSSGWDDCTRDRDRAEVRERWEPKLDREIWYSFSMYIPEDYVWTYPKQMFFQWHNGVWGPNAYFQLKREKFIIDILTKEHTTTSQTEIGTLERGKWHDFVINVRWTNKANGFMKVLVNGKYVLKYEGPTMDDAAYATGHGPHVKYGIYVSHKFRWEGPGPRPTHVLYFDEYRRGYRYPHVDIKEYQGD